MIRTPLRWLKNLLFACFVLAMLVCLCEVGLRVYDSVTGQITRRDLYDKGLICKSWFTHHTLKPSTVVQVTHPDTSEPLRLSINGCGLRGTEPAVPKPPGVYRIVCLGDDITFGSYVADEATFCVQLQQRLQPHTQARLEVINAGVPGYCPLLSYLQFKHHLLSLQPDLVILTFDTSDVADDYQYRRFTVMNRSELPASCAHPGLEMPREVAKNKPENIFLLPDFTKQKLGKLWASKVLVEKSRSIDSPQGRYAWLEDDPPDWTIYIAQTLAEVGHCQDLSRNTYSGFLLSVVPAPWQVSEEASSGGRLREKVGVPSRAIYRNRKPFETIQQFCQERRLALLDTSEAFQRSERPEQLFHQHSATLSAAGHSLYADELAQFLLRNLQGIWSEAAPGTPPTSHPSSTPTPPAWTVPQASRIPR